MRKIDANAFNKKILDKIKELDLMVKKINPENVKYFDAELIEAAENYIKVIKDCSWSSNSNFNGIEMHKIKDMLKYLKYQKRKIYVKRDIVSVNEFLVDDFSIEGRVTIDVPDKYDGRLSFIKPSYRFWKDGELCGVTRTLTTGKLMARKNAATIDIEFLFYNTEKFTTENRIWLDLFYILWR